MRKKGTRRWESNFQCQVADDIAVPDNFLNFFSLLFIVFSLFVLFPSFLSYITWVPRTASHWSAVLVVLMVRHYTIFAVLVIACWSVELNWSAWFNDLCQIIVDPHGKFFCWCSSIWFLFVQFNIFEHVTCTCQFTFSTSANLKLKFAAGFRVLSGAGSIRLHAFSRLHQMEHCLIKYYPKISFFVGGWGGC